MCEDSDDERHFKYFLNYSKLNHKNQVINDITLRICNLKSCIVLLTLPKHMHFLTGFKKQILAKEIQFLKVKKVYRLTLVLLI